MRQGVAPLVGLTTYVSIHASVKDATILNTKRFNLECVSIHASVKDATNPHGEPFVAVMFQSTHL